MKVTPLEGKALASVQHSTARLNVYEGSVRSGKTIGTLIDWIKFCRNGPDGNLLMTGRTERTVINNLILPIQEMLGTSRVSINRGTGTVDICGRTVLVIGANNEQARTKIQGLTLAGAYVDEASTLPESFFNMLTSRLSVHGAQLWATCNPEGPRHWFKLNWLDRAKLWIDHNGNIIDNRGAFLTLPPEDENRPLDLHRFSFTLDDNAHNLDPEYVASTKGMYSGLWYQRMILGLWTMADGMVFDMFDPARHVVDTLPEMQRIIAVGVDFGTTNPTAGVRVGVGIDNRLYLMDEWAPRKGAAVDELEAGLAQYCAINPPDWVYVDPSASPLKVFMQKRGWSNYLNGNNKVALGIGIMAALFSTDQLLIHRSCTHLLDELPGYVWDAKKAKKGEDTVVKLNDHFIDAARYGVATSHQDWQHMVPNMNADKRLEAA